MTGPISVADARIVEAVRVLRAGGLVAFPTETVYGLGADASNPVAVRRIFAAKGRPPGHPLIVHLPDAAALPDWARDIPEEAQRLAARFWPGPLTLVLKRGARVPLAVTGGQATVGVRVPSHPLALELLRAFGGGIAAPSANRFGRISPTTAQHVQVELDGVVDLILDGGPCPVGIESTIVDCSGARPALLRPGQVTLPQLEAALGATLGEPNAASPRAPGRLEAHYAPVTPLRLVAAEELDALLQRGSAPGLGVLAPRDAPPGCKVQHWMVAPGDPEGYARVLYADLRRLDEAHCGMILVELPPVGPDWQAIRDRLARAAAGAGPESP